jgi:ribulose-phosphate 3-epimerase
MNKKIEFAASMMCANYNNLTKEVKMLDSAGVDIFHIDIMDMKFVKNIGLGLSDIKVIRASTEKPLAAHLMVRNPDKYIALLLENGINIIHIHAEINNTAQYLYQIKDGGAVAGLVINPETGIEKVTSLLPITDRVLVMRVHPGFCGRPAVPEVENKIGQLITTDVNIGIDGAVNLEAIKKWANLGVQGFVLGTSALFGKGEYKTTMQKIRSQL